MLTAWFMQARPDRLSSTGEGQEARLVEEGGPKGRQLHTHQGQAEGSGPAHGLRGGQVPKHRGVLGRRRRPQCNSHHHADGGHLHSRLPILCSQDFTRTSTTRPHGGQPFLLAVIMPYSSHMASSASTGPALWNDNASCYM